MWVIFYVFYYHYCPFDFHSNEFWLLLFSFFLTYYGPILYNHWSSLFILFKIYYDVYENTIFFLMYVFMLFNLHLMRLITITVLMTIILRGLLILIIMIILSIAMMLIVIIRIIMIEESKLYHGRGGVRGRGKGRGKEK